jgi:predicted acylesterase/phospholipase RssA
MSAARDLAIDLSHRSRPSIGLVLGAGGTRGGAHAAVISVLAEAGIPIDLVVGASVGSIFGLGVAAGVPAERIIRLVQESSTLDMIRFYVGRLRPGGDNPIARLLLEAGEGKEFSDLPLPFAVMATDMETGRPTVLDRGPVLPAVQASIALPFIARPVELGGRYYLDGGLLDTAPVKVARQMGAERVIAVCLGYNYTAPLFLRRRPWTHRHLERLGTQRRPVAGRMRDQIRFGCRLYAASYTPPIPAEDADVVIWPEFGKVGPNSMSGLHFCFEQGLQAARAALPTIERLVCSMRQQA